MGVRIKDTNRIPDLIKTLKQLARKHIEVGIFASDDSFMVMIANVHEFGLTIRAKHKYLTIPTEAAGDRRAADFGDELFRPRGTDVLAIKKPGGGFEVMFILKESVTIPERSFMRSTFDEKEGSWSKFAADQLGKVLDGSLHPDRFFERIGQRIVADIQQKIKDINDPPNAGVTKARKGSSSPLIDSGRLRQAVTYRVVND